MAIDNCVGSNYLRRACSDSSAVEGGGSINASNLCSSITSLCTDLEVSAITVAGAGSFDSISVAAGGSINSLSITDTLSVGGLSSFNEITVTGTARINDLYVTGTQHIEHAENLYIGDPLITLNSGVGGANVYDIGWVGERGTLENIATIWDESADQFALISTPDDGSTLGNVTITAYEDLKINSLHATGSGHFSLGVSASGSSYAERLFYTGSDGSWLQVGDTTVTTAAAGVPSLSYDTSNSTFTYTPPVTGSIASKTATDYVLAADTGCAASKSCDYFVLDTETGSMASKTATDYVLAADTGCAASKSCDYFVLDTETGSMASKTATDYVLGTATGSMASKTATDYVLASDTGCAASKTCKYFTGQLFGYETGAAQTLDNGDSPIWHAATATWSYGPGGGGAGISLSDLSVTTAAAGIATLAYNNSNGVFTYTPPLTGTMASKTATDYVLSTATGSMASKTATNYVLGTATGSMASKTATDYVLASDTGCAASKTCEYFTGSLFGDGLKAGETFSNDDTPVWDSTAEEWTLVSNAAGGTVPGGNTTEIQYNDGGSFGGSAKLSFDSSVGVLKISGVSSATDEGGQLSLAGDTNSMSGKYWIMDTYGGGMRVFCHATALATYYSTEDGRGQNLYHVIGDIQSTNGLNVGTTGIIGQAEVGTWPANAGYAYFGHTTLDHTAATDYALLHAPDGKTYLNASTSQPIHFRENNADKAMISGGAMSIGASVVPSGTAGSLVVENDVIAFYTSDASIKHNIVPISGSLEKISKIDGVNFEWNTKETEKRIFKAHKAKGGKLDQQARERLQHPNYSYAHLSGPDVGVIAQQIEPILPQVVSTRPDGLKAVRYDKIVPLLIEGIKEQQTQLEDKQSQIDDLRKDVKDLKYWVDDN